MKITIRPEDLIRPAENQDLCPIARAYIAAGGTIPDEDDD